MFIVFVDVVMSNNDDLIDVFLLPPFGKSDHPTVKVLVKYSSNNSTDKFYLDYNNTIMLILIAS